MGFEETVSKPAENMGFENEEQEADSDMASKLSRELSNWRRKRGSISARPRDERLSVKPQASEPARTIKVRGHETLVIRKSKITGKPRNDANPSRE